MVYHPLHFFTEDGYIALAALGFDGTAPRNHPQRWKSFFNIIKPGIIHPEEIYGVNTFYVERQFCQMDGDFCNSKLKILERLLCIVQYIYPHICPLWAVSLCLIINLIAGFYSFVKESLWPW
jgi:hypothetical protein